jgi:hypothetical protein
MDENLYKREKKSPNQNTGKDTFTSTRFKNKAQSSIKQTEAAIQVANEELCEAKSNVM